MSNTDSFIDEVNEELKRDRLFALFRKYGWIAVVVVIGAVGYAAWNEWDKAQRQAQSQAFGDAVIAAMDIDDATARRAALAALAAEVAAAGRSGQGRAGIVNLLLAADQIDAGEREAALATLATVAGDPSLPASYRQLATLKRAILGAGSVPLSEREAALAPLAAAGQAFRPLALEQLALLRLEAGAPDEALTRLRALLDEPDISEGLRQRVMQMIVVLGGDPGTDLG